MQRLTILISLVAWVCLAGNAPARILTVPATAGALAQALASAHPHDTLMLQAGVHPISELNVRQPLTLFGNGKAVLDGGGKGQMLVIRADDVRVEGIVFKNSARGSLHDYAGLRAIRCKNVKFHNNRFENTFFAIHLSEVTASTVSRNIIKGITSKSELNTGNGIHLWHCDAVTILGNEISGHRDGIYFEFVTHGKIIGNISRKNMRYGLHFMFSHDDIYTDNTFEENGAGVAVMYSKRVAMTGNLFAHNRGGGAYGLLLKEITDGVIENNTFEDNTTGLYMEGSNRLRIYNNRFVANGWGVRLMANCTDDTFSYNRFSANTFDVSTNGYIVYNFLHHNYWDKYQGYDLNRDGLGDVPYHPLSLFSLVVEQLPAAMLLNRSLMVQLLDQAEKSIPSLTPDALQDLAPLMRPPKL